MVRSLLILLATATLAAAEEAPMKYRVYVGTYTGGKSKGIYRAELDLKTGALTNVALAAETGNPSFLAVHPSAKYLYAVRAGGGKEGTVSAFAIDPKTGDLKSVNKQSSKGSAL